MRFNTFLIVGLLFGPPCIHTTFTVGLSCETCQLYSANLHFTSKENPIYSHSWSRMRANVRLLPFHSYAERPEVSSSNDAAHRSHCLQHASHSQLLISQASVRIVCISKWRLKFTILHLAVSSFSLKERNNWLFRIFFLVNSVVWHATRGEWTMLALSIFTR